MFVYHVHRDTFPLYYDSTDARLIFMFAMKSCGPLLFCGVQ